MDLAKERVEKQMLKQLETNQIQNMQLYDEFYMYQDDNFLANNLEQYIKEKMVEQQKSQTIYKKQPSPCD